ncbi:MAG: MTH1187 family thiamine-binding protein [Deltaproteobacteria bacterium]|nr:MTH1187 family thiamine-binding protein [Deltaproteobacteria bacterium]
MSVIIELSIFPTDKGVSVSPYVARALDIIRESGLPYVLTPMATCIEGQWPAVMAVVDRCFKNLATDCDRVYLTLKADYRKGRTGGLHRKIASAEKKSSAESTDGRLDGREPLV